MSKNPIIYYFRGEEGFRGRAEVFKLALASQGTPFEVHAANYKEMKADRGPHSKYPFAQCPRFVDDEVDMVQSNAICRHIARKYSLYGDGSRAQAALVDMWLDGVEALRGAYSSLIYADSLESAALAAYRKKHLDPATVGERNNGAHFAYLEDLLARNGGAQAFCVGDRLSIADIELWEICDIHKNIVGDDLKQHYPGLLGHHARIAELPGIKEYLAGPQRLKQINANGLGQPPE
ncbi:unnamed protein product [Pedinophyceae sp. YPF-701]|nr:unnamed protein product [Pedinophyceae sp. YPF-701]